MASSALLVSKVTRAALRSAPTLMPVAATLLGAVDLVAVSRAGLHEAARLQPPALRTLDALHIATALALGTRMGVLITYDHRMVAAANWHGIRVVSPA